MKSGFNYVSGMVVAIGLFVSTMNAQAFALLGPVQPWMLASNGVIYPGDIGGPMSITTGTFQR